MWRHKKQNTSYKQSNIFFKSVLIELFTMIYFQKLFFHYVLTFSVNWIVLSAPLLRVCWAQMFLSVTHTDVFNSKYFIINGFLQMGTQLNTYEVANELFAKG